MAVAGKSVQLPDSCRIVGPSDLDTNSWGRGHLTSASLGHLVILQAPNSLEQ